MTKSERTTAGLAKNWRDPERHQLLFGYSAFVIGWTL
jgi:hypothetical protein